MAAFEDEWRLMQHGYTSPYLAGRAPRLIRRVLSALHLGRKTATPLRIGPEIR